MSDLAREKEALLSEWMYAHSQFVLRTSFYYVKDSMIAEDIAQEVFLRAYRHMDRFREEANVVTWLYRITVNVCKDYLKSWHYRRTQLTKTLRQADVQHSAEHEALRKINEHELTRQVMELPLKYREVIVLYYFEHLKSREIADLLGLKESAVRVRLVRGVEKLKHMLGGGAEAWNF